MLIPFAVALAGPLLLAFVFFALILVLLGEKVGLAILAIATLACLATGCAINRPVLTETVTGTNGVITTRQLKVTTFLVWPATQSIERQRASLGKTISVGQSGIEQEGGGTNVVEALKSIDSILGKVRP